MEKLVIAVLKSEHNVKLKKALVDKLLVSETAKPSAGFNMKEDFLFEIERIWSIGAESLDALSDNTGYETVKQLYLKKKSKYESFKQHYAILSSTLKYLFKSCDHNLSAPDDQPADQQSGDWCQHLVMYYFFLMMVWRKGCFTSRKSPGAVKLTIFSSQSLCF